MFLISFIGGAQQPLDDGREPPGMPSSLHHEQQQSHIFSGGTRHRQNETLTLHRVDLQAEDILIVVVDKDLEGLGIDGFQFPNSAFIYKTPSYP
jgi:hypothetical protein